MKKFVLSENGVEVNVGDQLVFYTNKNTLNGKQTVINKIFIDDAFLADLVKTGVVTEVNTNTVPMEIDYYINKIANKLKWNTNKTYNYLNILDSIMTSAACSLILREIAIELDKKYEDHIENSPEIYVISLFDGRITKANKAHIKNYRNFAAFRSIEDAKIACKIVKPILKDMFNIK